MTALPERGEIWWCELPDVGRRPVVVLSRDAAIPRLRRALIGPCTTTIRGLPSEVVLEPGEDPVPLRSAVNLDSVESVSIAVLVERLGRLSDGRMDQVCEALAVAVDCQRRATVITTEPHRLNCGQFVTKSRPRSKVRARGGIRTPLKRVSAGAASCRKVPLTWANALVRVCSMSSNTASFREVCDQLVTSEAVHRGSRISAAGRARSGPARSRTRRHQRSARRPAPWPSRRSTDPLRAPSARGRARS